MRLLMWVALAALLLAGCAQPANEVSGLRGLPDALRGLDRAPDLHGATGWLNSEPLDLDALAGTVVLVDFWTYSCVNCIRTLPHVTAWHDTYAQHGFTVIGVHSPEFEFEKKRANVEEAMARYGIEYPVAQDNDFGIWNDYHNRYWPAKYLLDAEGKIRYYHAGEGDYAETEQAIRDLLAEAGASDLGPRVEDGSGRGPRHGDITPELYAGTRRQPETLGNPEGYRPGQVVAYQATGAPERDRIYLDGSWTNGAEAMRAEGGGEVFLRFRAGAANFVVDGPADTCVPVTLDGEPIPEHLAGPDVDLSGTPCIPIAATPRSYDFYAGPVATHTVGFDVPDGFMLYTFAFSAYDTNKT